MQTLETTTTALTLCGQTLQLHSSKGIYWEEEKILLIADVHLGKAAHFRKNGIAVPESVANASLEKIEDLIRHFRPEKMIILGDLFHSFHNPEWELFGGFMASYASIQFELVRGNHDLLSDFQYDKFNLLVHQDILEMGPFIFSHEPLKVPFSKYNLCGHIHPGIRLKGIARQGLRLPCFYFGDHIGILPALGEFTGLAILKPKKTDRIFAITDHSVIPV